MKDETPRDFSMFGGDVVEEGQRFLDQFIVDKLDFIADFKDFDVPFETNMQDALDLCNATESDAFCVGKQAEQTAIIEELTEVGRVEFQTGETYIKLAFPKNAAKLRTFGQPNYLAARSSHVKLPMLLIQAYDMASDVDNKASLIAKGYTLLKIEGLKTAADNITTAVRKQNKLKGARNSTTQERTKNYNALWAMMVMISECAKKIYANNPVKWNQYLLYPDGPTPPTPPPTPPIA